MNNTFRYSANSLLGAAFAEPVAPTEPVKDAMFESAGTDQAKLAEGRMQAMFEAVERRAGEDTRSIAASLLITWAADGEPEADDFDSMALVLAGLDSVDDDTDFTDEQVDQYNDALNQLAIAALALGADQDDITSMIDDDDDAAAERVYSAIGGLGEDDDESIADYTVAGGAGGDAMLESASFKAVRDGVVKLIRKRPRKRRMTSLQKQALKKARSKAHSAMANSHRKKSMKLRKKRGL